MTDHACDWLYVHSKKIYLCKNKGRQIQEEGLGRMLNT